ncbi:MAG: hypothetical protein HY803_04110, partial [candidate division NC10 bacterium]|nr:hypothetical protein [candidate division NC10 bacterium]
MSSRVHRRNSVRPLARRLGISRRTLYSKAARY